MPRTKGAINKSLSKAEREKSAILDAKQKVFADALLEGRSKSEAARAAGYHPSNVDNVMRQEEIQWYLTDGRRMVSNITTIKRLDVLNIMLEAVDMARLQADPNQMINGAKEIGKMMGFYEPESIKVEVADSRAGDSKALASKLRGMTDEQLLELAFNRAKVVEGEVVSEDEE